MFVPSAGTEAAGSSVIGAIHNASRATGADFGYLLATARVESGLNPAAAARTSSAKGLYQFIEQTWLTTVKESGPALGFTRHADAIARGPDGRYHVADPAMRREIMALRNDASANAVMAGAFTRRNAALLTEKIGRKPSEGELYLAHFLGASGAARLINNVAGSPGASAAALFPNAARANRPIFFDRQGQARSVSEVYGVLVGRYNVARANPSVPAHVARAADPAPKAAEPRLTAVGPLAVASETVAMRTAALVPPPAPANAAEAPATAENTRPAFNSLFSSDPNRAPVSQTIRDLWSSRPHVAAALMGQPSAPTQPAGPAQRPAPDAVGAPLDLFPTQPTDAKALFSVRS